MTATDRPVPLPDAAVIVPMVTPLDPSGQPDGDSIDSLVDHLAGQGVKGVLALGSCGENGGLTRDQRLAVADRTIARAAGRVHVQIGVPALGTAQAVEDGRTYAAMGADALLVPAPFVFPHSAAELADHFRAVRSESGAVPVLAYNIPSRVGVNLEPELIHQLAEEKVISGTKDSSGDIEAQRILAERTAAVPDFRRYTGSEFAIDGLLLGGFHGAVPGLANPFAPLHVALVERAERGDWPGAAELQGRIVRLFELYKHPLAQGSFSAAVVGSLKEALVQQGVIATATTTHPFTPVDDAMREHVARVLAVAAELYP